MSSGENVVSRWSRLKRGEGAAPDRPTVAEVRQATKPWMPPLAAGAEGEDDPLSDPRYAPVKSEGAAAGAEAEQEPDNDTEPTPEDLGLEALSEEDRAYVESLPPVESLNAESDFSGYMDPRVPELLQKWAMRKLWASNPLFNFRDGLNDYDEDFSIIEALVAGTGTTYRPGKGHLSAEEEGEEAETQTQSAETPEQGGEPGHQRSDVRAPGEPSGPQAEARAEAGAETEADEDDLEGGEDEELAVSSDYRGFVPRVRDDEA